MALRKRGVRRPRRRLRRMRRRRPFNKNQGGRRAVNVNRMKANLHMPIVPHYYTKFTSGFTGYVTRNIAVTPATQSFLITLNSLQLPFDNSGLGSLRFTDMTSAALIPATVALNSLQPAGVPNYSALYSRYRVYAAKVTVTLTPGQAGTLVPFVLVAAPLQAGNSATASGSVEFLMSQPYAKAITCTNSNNIKQNTIVWYMDMPTLVGYTKQQYQDDPNVTGALGVGFPVLPINLQIAYQDSSSTTFTGTDQSYEVRLTQYCELYEPSQQLI